MTILNTNYPLFIWYQVFLSNGQKYWELCTFFAFYNEKGDLVILTFFFSFFLNVCCLIWVSIYFWLKLKSWKQQKNIKDLFFNFCYMKHKKDAFLVDLKKLAFLFRQFQIRTKENWGRGIITNKPQIIVLLWN